MKNEQYWRNFLKDLQKGTSSDRTVGEQQAAYQKAFEIISKPQNIISCLSVKDIALRIELIRKFPFLHFQKFSHGVSKITRKLK